MCGCRAGWEAMPGRRVTWGGKWVWRVGGGGLWVGGQGVPEAGFWGMFGVGSNDLGAGDSNMVEGGRAEAGKGAN